MVLTVSANGRVSRVSISSFEPSRVFNAEAIKAVKRWQFKPKSVNGVPVAQRGQLTVEFVCNV